MCYAFIQHIRKAFHLFLLVLHCDNFMLQVPLNLHLSILIDLDPKFQL